MPKRPQLQTDRPSLIDPLSDVLASTQLESSALANFFFTAPWGVDCGQLPHGAPFHAVISGRCVVRLAAGHCLNLGPGDLVLLPRWAPHILASSIKAPVISIGDVFAQNEVPLTVPGTRVKGPIKLVHGGGREPTHILSGVFFFRDRMRNPILNTLPDCMHFQASKAHLAPWLDSALRVLGEEAVDPRPGFAEMARRLADLLLVEMLRSFIIDRPHEAAGWLRAMANPKISRALQRVHSKPGEPWTLRRLAKESGMSRSSFVADFRRLVGESPMEYLTNWRMHLAMERLAADHLSITQIAAELGYTSQISFAKAFKRRVGESPGRFREQHRNDEPTG
jgi:AraC-like DNA-binding protein